MKKKTYLAIIAILVSHLVLSSCECPFSEYLEDSTMDVTEGEKWGVDYPSDPFYSSDIYGFWQCSAVYPMTVDIQIDFGDGIIGETEFKEIKFCDDGYADIYMQKKYDTDKRPFTLPYDIKKYDGKRYIVFGDENGTIFKALQIGKYIFPELQVGKSIIKKNNVNATITNFHANYFIGNWTCDEEMVVKLTDGINLGYGSMYEMVIQSIKFYDYYNCDITMSLSPSESFTYRFKYLYHDFSNLKFYTSDITGKEFAIDFGIETSDYNKRNVTLKWNKNNNYTLKKSK
jgi:hypothetical protein